MLTLEQRRKTLDMGLLYDVVRGRLDCPELVEQVALRAPARRTRYTTLFSEYLKPHEITGEDLRLPLDAPPMASARPLPASRKVEKIDAMDTTRSSVHSCCPCGTTRSDRASRNDKPAPKTNANKCTKPSDFLPTKTTSKEFISSGGANEKK
ncbi:hypothetical protein ACJJTC_014289 [Scirpophaga incertulas]